MFVVVHSTPHGCVLDPGRLNVFVFLLIFQGHCSSELPADLQRAGPRRQDWGFRDGSRYLQVQLDE